MTRVVHLHSAAWRDTAPQDRVRIDRRTEWGNPFRIGPDGDREQVIAKFRAWLLDSIDNDPAVLRHLRLELRGKVLGCWCAPAACHGDVLAAVADGAEP